MAKSITRECSWVCGMDVGDRWSRVCILEWETGEVVEESRVRTTREGLTRRFSGIERMRVAIEVGTHSAWMSELVGVLGHEVVVANPRQVRLIGKNRQKDDRLDAERLARLARLDPKLLAPVEHRRGQARADLSMLKARDAMVRSRTLLINHVRGLVKSAGGRLPSCSASAFPRHAESKVPPELCAVVMPVLEVIGELSRNIRCYDRQVSGLIAEHYPEAAQLQAIGGVGPVTALAFVLVIFRPERFCKSRDVAGYLGLTPARRDSGERHSQLGISKQGNVFLRRLVVQAAHYILGPFGPDCDLRRFGLRVLARGGPHAKKRAIVAVARKLAVIMHHLWMTAETYDPLYHTERTRAA